SRRERYHGGPTCDRQRDVSVLRLCARPLAIVAAVAVLTVAHPAFAQFLRPLTDPQGLQEPRKSPMTLTPSVTVSEEYNDNVFLDNTKKEWDMITRITPGVSFFPTCGSSTCPTIAAPRGETRAWRRPRATSSSRWTTMSSSPRPTTWSASSRSSPGTRRRPS